MKIIMNNFKIYNYIIFQQQSRTKEIFLVIFTNKNLCVIRTYLVFNLSIAIIFKILYIYLFNINLLTVFIDLNVIT